MELRDQAVLVTGGSRGLGAELVRLLCAEGARVVAVARQEAPLQAVVDAARAAGGEAYALGADVGDPDVAHALAASAAALVGPIDVLVHDASTLGPTPLRPLLDTAPGDFQRVLEVNLLGPFRLTQAIAGSMVLRRRGMIVHVSSDASVEAYPDWGAYSVSKAGLDHLARLWAVELGAHGVRSFSVDPGEMDTRMHREALPDADRATLLQPRDVAAQVVRAIRAADAIDNGARVVAQRWREAS